MELIAYIADLVINIQCMNMVDLVSEYAIDTCDQVPVNGNM